MIAIEEPFMKLKLVAAISALAAIDLKHFASMCEEKQERLARRVTLSRDWPIFR
jgi:hypothetical protein